MIKKWAKLLPYWFIMLLTKEFSGDIINSKELGECRGFRLDKGEWALFSKQNYDRMRNNGIKSKETKLEKKSRKLMNNLNKDYDLKQEIKKEFDYEEQRRKEEEDFT